MGDKMESEHTFSGGSQESGSSSDSSSGSSEGEDEATETIRVLGQTLELPQELCENYGIFKEVFSMRTWESLDEQHKELLKKYLPTFPDNDEEEKERTVRMLLEFEPFHFTSPLDTFYTNLRNGNYRPDIAKMRKFLMKARRKQARHRMRTYYARLLPEVLISRERLLTAARSMPPGRLPALPTLPCKRKTYYKPVHVRVKQRYFDELAAIRSEVGGGGISDDENYPEGPPDGATLRHKGAQTASNISGTLGGAESSEQTSLECLKNVLAAHKARRYYRENHAELNTTGITLDDIKQRVAFVNGAKKLMFGGPKNEGAVPKLKRGPKKDPDRAKPKKKEEDTVENRPLLPNIKIKCEQDMSDSEASFVDPVASPRVVRRSMDSVEVKQEAVDTRYGSGSINNFSMDPQLDCVIKQEPEEPSVQHARVIQPVPIKLEDLDGIDMMALPIEIADDCGEVTVNTSDHNIEGDEALTETTYGNFLCLVRALFPARSAHRASKLQLRMRCAAVMGSPIAPLNTWYHLSEDWCAELDSALEFLAGERGPHPEDFVPYLQYVTETQMYQWIGAGRDSDATLGRLYERWTRADPTQAKPALSKNQTLFVVRPPTSSELADFRRQERKRFAQSAKPFTYHQFGYRSVVGPCARAPTLATSHAPLLRPERPGSASLLTLVKDATARLPNGRGSTHDVLTLLKMSQWILPCSEHTLTTAVSSALDRMLSAKRDPVVKYDQRTATWTYLHRDRTEEDWLLKCSGRRKSAKSAARESQVQQNIHTEMVHSPPPKIEQEPLPVPAAPIEETIIKSPESGSDCEVDVLCSSPPPGQMSSAQLLMRTTASADQVPPPPKTKGKLVAVSPQKAKTIMKRIKNSQPAKQSNLVTQAIKQANQLVQTTKTKQIAKPTQAKNAPQNAVSPKQSVSTPKPSLMAQSAKQASVIAQLTKPPPKNIQTQPKTVIKPVQSPKTNKQPSKHIVEASINMTENNMPKPQANVVPKQESNLSNNVTKQETLFQQPSNVSKQESIVFQQRCLTPNQETIIIQHQDVPKQDTIVFQQRSLPKQESIVFQQESHVPKQDTIVFQQQSNAPKQETIIFQHQSNTPKQETILFQQQNNAPKQETIFFQQQSNIPKQEAVIYQQSKRENISKQQSNIPVQETVIFQQQSNIPKQETLIFKQQSNLPKQESIVFKKQSHKPKQEIIFQQQSKVQKQETLQQQSNTQKQETLFQQQSAPKQETIVFKQKGQAKEIIYQEASKEVSSKQTSKPTIISNIPIQQHILQGQLSQVKTQAKQEVARQKSLPTIVASRSPLIKQRPLQRQVEVVEQATISVPAAPTLPSSNPQTQTTQQTLSAQTKASQSQATRSLLIRTPQSTTSTISIPSAQTSSQQRRGIVRVLSPAGPTAGKSLISPRALVQHSTPVSKKRSLDTTQSVTPQPAATSVATSTMSTPPRTVQLSSGQRLQLAANQTVHLPTGQAVQLQLSALQLQNLGTHSVRLPSGQTVQLASPQSIKLSKNSPKQSPTATFKTQPLQIPISSVQLTGQTVQIGGQTVQIAGQLTGHTVKLSSGQSLQVASPNVISQNVLQRQVQLGNLQTVQLGHNVQLGQNVQLSGQTVQLGGQTVQLPSGQTIQLASGQTIQLASGQTVQLSNPVKTTPKSQIIDGSQTMMAKLLTNQSQTLSMEGGSNRAGMRVLPNARLTRPLLLTSGKPLHNIILQQSDGSTIRMTSSGQAATSQTIVFSNIGAQTVTTSSTSAPVLKLQQATGSTSGTVRGVVMDGQQLKLVRILQHPPQH